MKKNEPKLNYWVLWVLALALLTAFLVSRAFPLSRVIGPSMEPLLQENDWIVSCAPAYTPGKNDVVLVHKADLGETIVKRVMGLPGDTLEIKNGTLFRNGTAVSTDPSSKENMEKITVPQGCYFLMGDNRAHSTDSRKWENPFVTQNEIIGKVLVKIFPEIKQIS